MKMWQYFGLIGIVILAPHVSEQNAKAWGMLFAAGMFALGALEVWGG